MEEINHIFESSSHYVEIDTSAFDTVENVEIIFNRYVESFIESSDVVQVNLLPHYRIISN